MRETAKTLKQQAKELVLLHGAWTVFEFGTELADRYLGGIGENETPAAFEERVEALRQEALRQATRVMRFLGI